LADRFRLIYLKSTGLEKEGGARATHPVSDHFRTATTFSSQAILNQAKTDLKNPDPKARAFAIQYLENSAPSIAIPLLQEALPDRDPAIRAKVLSSLTKFRDPMVYPLLKKYLKDSDPRVKIAALRGMFKFKERIDLNILLQLLSDESSRVRRKLATLLGWTQVEGAFPILAELSKDTDATVRKAALFSMITNYPEEGEDRLVESLTDLDPDLRKWARTTLERMVKRPLKEKLSLLSKWDKN